MQAFVASLTAAVLFIHTVFGCCWHHAHQCEHGSTVSQPAKCCHHHQHDSDTKQPEKPCQGDIECQGTCSYVVPQKVQVQAPQWISIDLLAVLPSLANQQIDSAAACEARLWLPVLTPRLRTHLLHQVLLN